jgi:TRAP-type C4-dicarboxylate transport system permease small subunit
LVRTLDRVCKLVDGLATAAVVVLFAAMIAIGTAQIVNRFFLGLSLSWAEEAQRYAHIWLVFFTIPMVYRMGAHIGVDVVLGLAPPGIRRAAVAVIDLLWLVMGGIIVVLSLQVMQVARMQTTPGLELRMDLVYLGILLGGGYMALTAVRRLVGLRELPGSTGEIHP